MRNFEALVQGLPVAGASHKFEREMMLERAVRTANAAVAKARRSMK
jgi:hypothetical protein